MTFNPYERLTDAELDAEIQKHRDLAHNAPKALDNASDAWSRHSAEYARLSAEKQRRSGARHVKLVPSVGTPPHGTFWIKYRDDEVYYCVADRTRRITPEQGMRLMALAMTGGDYKVENITAIERVTGKKMELLK